MATCGANKKLIAGGELHCDLDDGHLPLLSFHYDALEKMDWRENNVPQSVAYNPTGPMLKLKASKT